MRARALITVLPAALAIAAPAQAFTPRHVFVIVLENEDAATAFGPSSPAPYLGLPAADGQVLGQGCAYPPAVETVADQLEAAGFTWRAYMEDTGDDPARDGRTCAHPILGTRDTTQLAAAGSAR